MASTNKTVKRPRTSAVSAPLRWLGLVPQKVVEEQAVKFAEDVRVAEARAYTEAVKDFRSIEDEPTNSAGVIRQGYNSAMSGLRGPGDLSYDEINSVVWQVFLRHPVAKRIIELKRDHILGRGVRAVAEDDSDLQEVLDKFWRQNRLRRLLRKITHQLYLFGEQIIIASVRKTDGRVRLGYIDPTEVGKVILHPENALEKCAVVLKESHGEGLPLWATGAKARRVYRIVRPYDPQLEGKNPSEDEEGKYLSFSQAEKEPWEKALLEAYGLTEYTGDVFYWSTNDVANQERGLSDLHQLIPHLAYLEDVLMTLADRENMAALAAWEVEMEGATDEECRAKAQQLAQNPPRRSSFIVHNDKEAWRFVTTGMEQAGSISVEQALLDMVFGGAGMPRGWFGEGGGENRATAREQNRPAWMTLQFHQDELRDYLLDLVFFVRDQAEIAGAWSMPAKKVIDPLAIEADQEDNDGIPEPGKVVLEMAEVSTLDIQALSVAMERLSTSLGGMVEMGWMTRKRAVIISAKVLREIGVEFDPEVEYVLAQAEQAQDMSNMDDQILGDDELGAQDDPNFRSDRLEPDEEPEPEELTGDEQITDMSKESVREDHSHSPETVDSECPLCHERGALVFGEEHGSAVVCSHCGSTYDVDMEAPHAIVI